MTDRTLLRTLPGLLPAVLARGRAAFMLTVAVLAATAAVAAPRGKPPPPVEGVINRIVDGDTLTLQPDGKPLIEVRLRDMDAPEICQPHGTEAKKALEEFALGKKAVLTGSGRDSYGRTVGVVTVDGQSVSKWMVAEGHAWSTRYRFDRGPLMKEERMAVALRRGLHATQGAVMPKDFRKTNGPCKRRRRAGRSPARQRSARPARTATSRAPSAVPSCRSATARRSRSSSSPR